MKNFIFFCLFHLLSLAQTQIGVDIDGEAAGDYSGNRISLSADGNAIAIGAFLNDGNGVDSGSVRVYKNTGGTWSQIGTDIDGEAAGDESGRSVSLSDDGTTVAIGAIGNDGSGIHSGHVRVYKNIAGIWSQVGTDIDGEMERISSGHSVSLSADGTIVAIGATGSDGNGVDSGSVSVYKNNTGTWIQIGSNINGEAADDFSGISVSLSADGSTVAIGALGNDSNGFHSGHVRIYKNTSGTWTQLGADIDGEAAGDCSGESVSISADGTTVAIGAQANWGNGSNSGHVRVFKNTAGTWTQIGMDINGDMASDYSGTSVSLSADGTIVAIGAIDVNGNGVHPGHTSIYKNKLGTWTRIGVVINGEFDGDWSGSSVSFSANGETVAIGAPHNTGNGTDSGHVRIYDISAQLPSDSFVLTHFCIYPNPTSEAINISLQDNFTLEKVNIYNALGQLIKTEKQNKINISTLAKGSYLVEVVSSKGKATKTIIVE